MPYTDPISGDIAGIHPATAIAATLTGFFEIFTHFRCVENQLNCITRTSRRSWPNEQQGSILSRKEKLKEGGYMLKAGMAIGNVVNRHNFVPIEVNLNFSLF